MGPRGDDAPAILASVQPSEIFEAAMADGVNLHVEAWRPHGPPRFVVLVSHGAAEHVGRYGRLAKAWTEEGALVLGPDHRGQGRSGGPKGFVDRFERYGDDLVSVVDAAKARFGAEINPARVPWFLFGHSMGGLIALVFCLDHATALPLRGCIVSNPLLGATVEVPWMKRTLAKVMLRVWPTLAVDPGLPPADISRDPGEVKRYVEDKRRVTVLTPGWAHAMEQAIARVESNAERLTLPMLWALGSADRVCDPQASLRVYGKLADAKAHDQRLEVFDGYYHELHNEPPALRAPVEKLYAEWLRERLA
jgi:alpha-beta hydrolase superfamily lysophospholipase